MNSYERELELESALEECPAKFGKDGVYWCELAGTNQCDFQCPNSRDVMKSREEIEKEDG